MPDALSLSIETKEVTDMINGLLNKLENPRPLLKKIQAMIHALTGMMFKGRRADKTAVRGVKWPKLAKSTINRKKQMARKGKLHGGATPSRAMIEQGTLRDKRKVLEEKRNGFIYGSPTKSKKGFSYPGFHNAGRFPWLFLRNPVDYVQLGIMTKDYIDGFIKNTNSYVKG